MDINTAREIAARIWTDQEMSKEVMDTELAEQIARLLVARLPHGGKKESVLDMKPSEILLSKGWRKMHPGRDAELSDWLDPITNTNKLFKDAINLQYERDHSGPPIA